MKVSQEERDFLLRIPLLPSLFVRFRLAKYRLRQSRLLDSLGSEVRVVTQGVMMELDLTELHDVFLYDALRSTGFYERETTLAIIDRLMPGDLFIDAGANNGYFSLIGAKLVGENGSVVAIEPNPRAYRRLCHNVGLNRMERIVRPYQLAVSDKEGKATLFASRFEDGWGSLVARSGIHIPVSTTRLDRLVAVAPRVTVKVDVEGSESSVIQGMSGLVERTPNLVLIVEWNRRYADSRLTEVLSKNFSISRIRPESKGYSLEPISDIADLNRIGLSNLWCTHVI